MLYQWGIVCKQSNVSESVSEWVSEWVSQSVSQSVRAWVSEWVSESVSEWVSVYVMTIFISSLVVDCVNVNVPHMCCKLERALSHYCLVQSIFNVWWNKICLNQSNVQISLLNFSLYYERFNFYNPLLFSLHPTSLSKWKSQLIILTCPVMIQRSPGGRLQVAVQSPLGDFPCLGCRQITPGSPSGIPTASRRRTADVHVAACGFFFRRLHPKFPRVAERRPAGDWAAPRGTLAD